MSWHGRIHVLYLGVGYAISITSLMALFWGKFGTETMWIGWPGWIGITGGVLYLACVGLDVMAGRFDKLKKAEYMKPIKPPAEPKSELRLQKIED